MKKHNLSRFLKKIPFIICLTLTISFISCLFTTIQNDKPGQKPETKSEQKSAETAKPSTSKGPIPPPKRDLPGKKIQIKDAEVFVPDFFKPAGDTIDIVIFFHGAAWCSEQGFYDAGKNAVLISTSVKNFEEYFKDDKALQKILDECAAALKKEKITEKPAGSLTLSSFSGGYTAVRAILRQDKYEGLISNIVLADSLYCGKLPGDDSKLDPEQMAPFVKYAKKAADGKISFIFSQLYPPLEEHRGNTTTLTASYLIDAVGAEKKPASGKNSRGAELLYRADKGNLHILGYSGMTTQDHFEHFYSIADLYRQTSLKNAEK